MRPTGRLRLLHLRRLRDHPGRAVLSLAGIGVGSMLVVTMLGLFGSLTGSVGRLADLAGEADLEVSAPTDAGMDAAVLDEVRAVPGTASAVPLVRAPVSVGDRTVLLLGGDPRDGSALGGGKCGARLAPSLPAVPAGAVPVVAGERLAARLDLREGSTATVFGGGRTNTVVAVGTIGCDQAAALNDGFFLATTLEGADTLTGRSHRIDAVFVTVAPASPVAGVASGLRAAVGDQAVVASPRLRVELARKGLKPLQQGLSTAVSLAFVVAGFLVYNTMSMAALERRRELATLRAIGARRRPLLLGFLVEAAAMGFLGGSIGAALGVVLARASLGQVPTIVLDYLGVRPSYSLPALAVPSGVGVAVLATVASAAFPARAAVGVAPVDAMRPEGVLESGRGDGRTRPVVAAVGVAVFVAGNLLTTLGRGNAVLVGFGAITAGAIVTTAGLMGAIASAAGRAASLLRAPGRLAAAGVQRAPRRAWATALAVTVGVGVVVALGGIVRNQEATFTEDFRALASTDLWVQTTTPDTVPTQPLLPSRWADDIARLPGVARVSRDQAAYMTLGDEQVLLEGSEPGTGVPFFRNAGAAGEDAVRGRGLLASRAWADRHRLGVGDVVELPTPSGLQRERITALVDLPVIVQGQLGIDHDRFSQWFGRAALTGIEVQLAQGADPTAVRRGILEVTAGSPVAVRVYSGEEVLAGSQESLRQSLAIFNLMVWVVVGATGLAILNTTAISVVERRRELGILRAVGTSRRTIAAMVAVEAAAITLVGTVLGVVLGLVQHRVGIQAMAGLVGFTVEYRPVVAPLLVALVAAAVMTAAGAVGPAIRAGRVDVIEAIGYE